MLIPLATPEFKLPSWMQPKGGFLKGGAITTEDSIRQNHRNNDQKSLLPSFTMAAAAFPCKGFRGFSR